MKKLLVCLSFLNIFSVCPTNGNSSLSAHSGALSRPGDVYLKRASNESVRVEVSGTDIKNVITDVSGDYLKIQMAEGRYNRSRSVKVYVTYVDLSKISCSSASSIYSEDIIKTRSMSLSASSAEQVTLADTEHLTISASSAAEVELRGWAPKGSSGS